MSLHSFRGTDRVLWGELQDQEPGLRWPFRPLGFLLELGIGVCEHGRPLKYLCECGTIVKQHDGGWWKLPFTGIQSIGTNWHKTSWSSCIEWKSPCAWVCQTTIWHYFGRTLPYTSGSYLTWPISPRERKVGDSMVRRARLLL